MKYYLLFIIVFLSLYTNAQDTTQTPKPKVLPLQEVVISANRQSQNSKEIPNTIIKISRKKIDFYNPQTTADFLQASGKVFVQKSQLGGGSPMLRGYSANRILLVTDGVRMNNAIFRSGNLQNIIAVDPNSIEHTEIIAGSNSVTYGSDAIGGVISLYTIKPKTSTSDKAIYNINSMLQLSSANEETTKHIDFNVGFKKLAFLTSFTYSNYNDLKMGNKKHPEYQCKYFVKTLNNSDIIKKNKNPNIQKFTGYSQFNIMQKVLYRPTKNYRLEYAFQFSKTSDIPRYDRLMELKNSLPKYAQWYYGSQIWQLQSLSMSHISSNLLYDKLRLLLAYQNFKESRHSRKLHHENLRSRFENLHALSVNLDLVKYQSSKTKLFYGVELLQNKVYSEGKIYNIKNHNTAPTSSRYPDNSDYYACASYFSLTSAITNKLYLTAGTRYTLTYIYAPWDNRYYKVPLKDFDNQTNALTGSLGLNLNSNGNSLKMNLATGFRTPNIDDVSKVFDSEPGNVIIPNPSLKPEYIYSVDLGYSLKISNIFKGNITAFYSYLNNAFVRQDGKFNGQDSIIYDGELSRVQQLVNAQNAQVYGVSLSATSNLTRHIQLKYNLNLIKGFDNNHNPLRHVNPTFANLHLIYKYNKIKLDFYTNYNGKISFKNLAKSERKKPHIYALNSQNKPYSPAWYTLNLSGIWQINKFAKINFAVENILNHRYRPYSSGITAPGRNFILSIYLDLKQEVLYNTLYIKDITNIIFARNKNT